MRHGLLLWQRSSGSYRGRAEINRVECPEVRLLWDIWMNSEWVMVLLDEEGRNKLLISGKCIFVFKEQSVSKRRIYQLTVMAPGEHHAVDVEQLVSSMETTLSSQSFSMCPDSCIFPTPNILLRHSRKAYTPTAFSIGPLHHRKAYLKRTEKVKQKYLQNLVSRTGVALKDLIGTVAKIEADARKHYAEYIDFRPEELVKILVLDGCFLIEFIRKHSMKDSLAPENDDPVFTMSCMFQHLYHDLILLENQIPWIVLDHLFNLTRDPQNRQGTSNASSSINWNSPDDTSLLALVLEFFHHILPGDPKKLQVKTGQPKSRHILELLRDLLISNSNTNGPLKDENTWPPIPSATELETAGVTLRRSSSPGLDISFKNGVLEVSQITIQEVTEALFRNIISFEQCSQNCLPVFTSYAILLDNLINSPEDVDRLSKKEIVDNWLNPEDATKFFNELYHDAYVKDFYYPKLCYDVKRYYQMSWPSWRTSLVQNYFSTPWVVASTFAAIFLLVLTFLQTLYSVKGDPHKGPK
ncbi:UPF0481 protein At3g47200-like [Punica granatum]|uniref:UPF0481 protein At3g47200-like n=1 Tax=Punica granatum TaxID=22663 RepID=A0A6P8CHS5_PUNGR|nr:UPF0481 protein At3g47200-like [Punica granatum]